MCKRDVSLQYASPTHDVWHLRPVWKSVILRKPFFKHLRKRHYTRSHGAFKPNLFIFESWWLFTAHTGGWGWFKKHQMAKACSAVCRATATRPACRYTEVASVPTMAPFHLWTLLYLSPSLLSIHLNKATKKEGWVGLSSLLFFIKKKTQMTKQGNAKMPHKKC